MQYEVVKLERVDFGATGVKEILQNVAFILSTVISSCPMDRGFGWKPDLDAPIVAAKAINTARIIKAINDNEPRVNVDEVIVEIDSLEGKIKSIVRVSINE